MNIYKQSFHKLIGSAQFKIRALSAIILLALALTAIIIGGYLFTWLICICALVMIIEWEQMIRVQVKKPLGLNLWRVIGMSYILLPSAALLYLRYHTNGLELMLWLVITVICTDIGAYVIGSTVGGPKLAPKISPAKSWAGATGGVLLASLIGIIFFALSSKFINYAAFTPLLSIIAVLGDLLESYFKRKFKIKDSGKIIPGHGGILDRLDSVLAAAILVLILIL